MEDYHHKPPLHDDVIKAIRPTLEQLSSDNLLERCVGSFTQNANESLNNLIWRKVAKVQHTGAHIVTNIAASTFNEGASVYSLIMHALEINVGRYCATLQSASPRGVNT